MAAEDEMQSEGAAVSGKRKPEAVWAAAGLLLWERGWYWKAGASALLLAAVSLALIQQMGEAAYPLPGDAPGMAPGASYVVSGQITDTLTGWPLYARIDILGGPPELVWSDPATGNYSLALAEGITYTFQVQAFLPGYMPHTRTVGPLTGDRVEDYALETDLQACSTPGYRWIGYSEDFETSDGGYTHAGAQDEWEWGAPVTWPSDCASGSLCWGTDLDGEYENGAYAQLLSPVIDLSGIAPGTPLSLSWQQAWELEDAAYDHASAEVSINSAPYQLLWQHTGPTAQVDWTELSFDLSQAAGGTARLRFTLSSDTSTVAAGYYIDQVRIGSTCAAPTGGLLVGNVYEAPSLEGLSGAVVSTDEGQTFVAVDTPEDPLRADGFYTVYAAPGLHAITATHPSYDPAVFTVEVSPGLAVERSIYLGATGDLLAIPSSLQALLLASDITSTDLHLINLSASPVEFEIVEENLPLSRAGPLEDVPWLSTQPVSGSLPVGAAQAITVTFEAGPLPGEYHAALRVTNDSPSGEVSVPVTMTVAALGVEIAPAEVSLAGDPGDAVTATLFVTNTGTISQSFDVLVSGNAWGTTAPLGVGPLTPGEWAPLVVYVDIPSQAQAGEADSALISVASQMDPGVSDSAQLVTHANAVYGLQIDPQAGSASAAPGETVTYSVSVTNTGNAPDTYGIELESMWYASAPVEAGPVAAGQGITMAIGVDVPPEALAGAWDSVTAAIISQGDGTRSAGAVFTTTASAVYDITLLPVQASQRGDPGGAITYTLEVTNSGNISDSYSVLASSSAWTVSAAGSIGPLSPGQAGELPVTVTIPAEAEAGDTNTVTVTLVSQGEPSLSVTARLTSQVSHYAVSLEPATINAGAAPGATVTYTLYITNTGDTTDGYTLAVSQATPGWSFELPVTWLGLAPGESQPFNVRVHIPAGARFGDEGALTLSASGSYGALAACELRTVVDRGVVYLPKLFNTVARR